MSKWRMRVILNWGGDVLYPFLEQWTMDFWSDDHNIGIFVNLGRAF